MPEYNPTIHEPVIIDPKAFAFVTAYVSLDSDSFGNLYQSAIRSGYSQSYARIVGRYFPKHRIKKLLLDMEKPLAQSIVKDLQAHPEEYYRPSKRAEKRMRTEANRRFKELEVELRLLDIE